MEQELYHAFAQNEKTHWWFVGRRQIFKAAFARYLPKRTLRILDVGCGTGGNVPLLSAYGSVTGVDNNQTAVDFASSKGYDTVVRADATRLPFTDSSFDCIVALDIIEHLKDEEAFVRELQRVVTPGGYVVISTAAFSFLWSSHDTRNQHVRRYTKQQLRSTFTALSWHVVFLRYYNWIFFPFIAIIRLLQRCMPSHKESAWELTTPPPVVNVVLRALLAGERFFLPVAFPWGVSLFGIFKKPV